MHECDRLVYTPLGREPISSFFRVMFYELRHKEFVGAGLGIQSVFIWVETSAF
jgi:hypothetical protein